MQGRGLLIILMIFSAPYASHALDSGADEFSDFEEIKETPGPGDFPEEPQPIPEETATPPPKISEPELPSVAEPAPLQATPAEPPVATSYGEDPDFRKEERFHEIYRKYNQGPTPNDSWDKAASKGKAQVYSVHAKDTLWGISGTLFGDSHFWPKIWSLNNEEVLNPHEIAPGMKIKFFPGDLSEAPAVMLTESAKGPTVKEGLASNENDLSQPPPPFRKTKKLKKVPDSLPLYRFGVVNKPKPKVEIENLRKPIVSPLVSVSHYVIEGELSSSGEVKETELGGRTASEFQYIIVRIDDASQKIFYAVKVTDTIQNPFTGKGPKGHMVEILGEVEILERVSEKDNLFRAVVTKNVAAVEIGAKLVAGKLPRANVSETTAETGPDCTIIGGQFSGERKLYSKFTFVFLDAGSSRGIHDGQTLSIYTNLKNRNPNSEAASRNRQIGTVKILKTTENLSTGYILDATEDIWIGDSVGGSRNMASSDVDAAQPESDFDLDKASSSSKEVPQDEEPADDDFKEFE